MVELAEAMGKRSIDNLITYFNGEDIEGHCSHCQTVMKAEERLLTYGGVGKCTTCTKRRAVDGQQGERSACSVKVDMDGRQECSNVEQMALTIEVWWRKLVEGKEGV